MAIPEEILETLRRNDPTYVEDDLSEYVESFEDIQSLVAALSNNIYFKKLTIQGKAGHLSRVNDEGAKLLSQCQCLSEVDISFNKDVTNEGIAYFAQTPLRVLQAYGCGVTGEAFLPFFHHKFLLRLALGDSTLKLTFGDETQIGLMLRKNTLIKKAADCIAALLRRFPEVIIMLPPPVRTLAERCDQDKVGDDIEIRTLIHNLSKIEKSEGERELKQAQKLIEEYMDECRQEVRLKMWHPMKATEPAAKKTKVEPEEEQCESSGSPSLSPDI